MNEQERFDRCLAVVLEAEGGYADHPRDPGGPTNLGVTLATLSSVLGRPAKAAELKAMTADTVKPIYRDRYWRIVRCAETPVGLDLLLFDTAVNMGPACAVRLLQGALNTDCDGVFGSETLKAVLAAPTAEIIARFGRARWDRYRQVAGFDVFGRGWLARVDRLTQLALSDCVRAGGSAA